ncbi:MAG: esterase-like activity of phytase family protein [Pseudomonadota bacterium]
MRGFCILLAACLCGCDPPASSSETGSGLNISQSAIPLEATELNGLTVLSAYELNADPAAFGGFSGLSIDGGSLVAVSDRGWWLDATVASTPSELTLTDVKMVQMEEAGQVLEKQGGDAEGLTRQDGAMLVSFERDHRIMTREGPARLGGTLQQRAFESFATNKGLESLATLPSGRLLAIGEQRKDNGFVVYVLGQKGIAESGWLPPVTRHAPTGADLGPDGKLYVVFRDYSPLFGVSIIVRRYGLDDSELPDPATREDLARFESETGIDNMEGISLWQDASGATRLTLISDDNFNALQRTILVDMAVN